MIAAGFDSYHLAEHHATPLGMAPSPSVFLAAVAQRTKRLRFGPMVYMLPLPSATALRRDLHARPDERRAARTRRRPRHLAARVRVFSASFRKSPTSTTNRSSPPPGVKGGVDRSRGNTTGSTTFRCRWSPAEAASAALVRRAAAGPRDGPATVRGQARDQRAGRRPSARSSTATARVGGGGPRRPDFRSSA